MKARVLRLLLLSAVVAAALWSPSYAWADLLCPTDECTDLQAQCIAEGGNHDYFGFRYDTGQDCVQGSGTANFMYVDCCRLPGCTELIWRRYCYH
jgi:hypothetical protein